MTLTPMTSASPAGPPRGADFCPACLGAQPSRHCGGLERQCASSLSSGWPAARALYPRRRQPAPASRWLATERRDPPPQVFNRHSRAKKQVDRLSCFLSTKSYGRGGAVAGSVRPAAAGLVLYAPDSARRPAAHSADSGRGTQPHGSRVHDNAERGKYPCPDCCYRHRRHGQHLVILTRGIDLRSGRAWRSRRSSAR